jgi:hypothetical protein
LARQREEHARKLKVGFLRHSTKLYNTLEFSDIPVNCQFIKLNFSSLKQEVKLALQLNWKRLQQRKIRSKVVIQSRLQRPSARISSTSNQVEFKF